MAAGFARSSVFALCALLSAGAQGATLENHRSGNWLVGAYSDDRTGQFSHCAMSVNYPATGTTMLFGVRRDFTWNINFFNPSWKLVPGAVYDVTFAIDGGQAVPLKANASNEHFAWVALPGTKELFESFRRGRNLMVFAAGQQMSFSLAGTSAALNETLGCTQRYVASSQPRNAGNPFMAAQRGPDRGNQRTEATTLMANVLSASGISGYKILLDSERPPAARALDVMWVAGDVYGGLTILPQGDMNAFRADLMAGDAKSCDGKFATASSEDGIQELCAEPKGTWTIYYTFVPRRAGGSYLFMSMGSGTATQPAEADNIDIRNAAYQTISGGPAPGAPQFRPQ